MAAARANGQLTFGPGALPIREQGRPVLSKQEQQPQVPVDECDAAAALLFDAALTAAGITSQEAAHLLGVSESMVRKMRSADYRERVSFVQLLKLPPTFHLQLHLAMNRRFGFGRQLLARVLDDIGALAVIAEAK